MEIVDQQIAAGVQLARMLAMLRVNGAMSVDMLAKRAGTSAAFVHRVESAKRSPIAPMEGSRNELVHIIVALQDEGLMTETQVMQAHELLLTYWPPTSQVAPIRSSAERGQVSQTA
jgi:hypothetical protein